MLSFTEGGWFSHVRVTQLEGIRYRRLITTGHVYHYIYTVWQMLEEYLFLYFLINNVLNACCVITVLQVYSSNTG